MKRHLTVYNVGIVCRFAQRMCHSRVKNIRHEGVLIW